MPRKAILLSCHAVLIAMVLCAPVAAGELHVEKAAGHLQARNLQMTASVDLRTGRIDLRQPGGRAVLEGTTTYILASGRTISPADYSHHSLSERKRFSAEGEEREFTVRHFGDPALPELVQHLTLTEEGTVLFLDASLVAGADQPPTYVRGFNVLQFDMTKSRDHWFSPISDDVVMMRQGTRMPSDRRVLVTLEHKQFPDSYDWGYLNYWMRRETPQELDYISESFTTLLHTKTHKRIFLGFVTQHDQATQIVAERRKADSEFLRVTCFSDYEGNPLSAGQTLASEVLAVDFLSTPEEATAAYVEQIKRRHGQPSKKEPGAIWSTWDYYRKYVTEEEVLKNMDAIRALNLDIEYIHIDDGYYNVEDEWLGANERFPHGMKWMADQIRARGFKASLWINPFVTLSGSRISREHPDWMVRDSSGKLLETRAHNLGLTEVSGIQRERIPVCYVIDYTVPAAREWLRRLIHTLVHEWGYTRLKLDGPGRHYYNGRGPFSEPTVTTIANIRIAYEIIRVAVGEQAHVFGEGYFGPSYGYADSHSVTQDWASNWKTQRGHLMSRLLTVYPWPSHDDGGTHLQVDYERSPLWEKWLFTDRVSEGVKRIDWTSTALRQGKTMSFTEKLHDLDDANLKLLHQFLPTYGSREKRLDAGPVDAPASLIEKSVVCSWGKWSLVGAFNYSDEVEPASFAIKDLNVPQHARRYHVFDFWRQRYYGTFEDVVTLDVPPGDALLLSVRDAEDHPQVLASDMHYTQGAAEFTTVQWDHDRQTLHWVSAFDYQRDARIVVHVPQGFAVKDVSSTGVEGLRWKVDGEVLSVGYKSGSQRSEFTIQFGRSSGRGTEGAL